MCDNRFFDFMMQNEALKKTMLLNKVALRPLTFAQLVAKSLNDDLVFAEEYYGLDKFWEGWVNIKVDFEKNEIHLGPDLSKPDEWFFYDEGFVKCYVVNPSDFDKKEG